MGDASKVRRAERLSEQTGPDIVSEPNDKEIFPIRTWLELVQSPRAFPARG